MSFASLLVNTATLYRKGAPAYEFGMPVENSDALVAVTTFPCRVDFTVGDEYPQARSEQTAETRTATIFCLPGVQVLRQDKIETELGWFEVRGRRLVQGFAGPHHWELICDIIEGN